MTDVSDAGRDAPLAGTVVLDLGQIYNGPYCAWLLGRMGARVVKIEHPRGDLIRQRTRDRRGPYSHLMLNSGKESVVIDLATVAGKEIFLRLVERSDVVVENFSAGAMERLGLGYDVLRERNARIVLASSTGFGTTGPYASLSAMDLSVQAMCGLIDSTGFPDGPPVKAGAAITDFLAGTHLAAGVLAALLQRERSGTGQWVECSMLDAAVISMCSSLSAVMDRGPDTPRRTGNRHPALSVAPYNVYPASDGHLAINCPSQHHWEQLAEVMERPDLIAHHRFRDPVARTESMDELDRIIASWTSARTRDQLQDLLAAAGVPCGAVRSTAEVLVDDHLWQRGSFVEVADPVRGPVALPTGPLRFGAFAAGPPVPAPDLGSDTRTVLRDLLGLADGTVDGLIVEGAIGPRP